MLYRRIAAEVHACAIAPLPWLLGAAAAAGAAVLALADAVMRPNGMAPHLAGVVAHALVCVVAPLAVGLALVPRAAAAAEALARLRVRRRAPSRRALLLGVALPRLLGAVLGAVALGAVLAAAAVAGGFHVAAALGGVSPGLRLEALAGAATPARVLALVGETAALGAAAALVGCGHGLHAAPSAAGRARAGARCAALGLLATLSLQGAAALPWLM